MRFDLHFDVEAPGDVVLGMLANPAFAQFRAETDGVHSAQGTVTLDKHGFVVRLRRVYPPDLIPAKYRIFAPPRIAVVQTERWHGPRAALKVDVELAPIDAAGEVTLTDNGDGTSRLRLTGDLRARIPFVGSNIERAIVDVLGDFAEHERRAAERWLADATATGTDSV